MKVERMIKVVCFKWHKPGYRTKFTGEHVNILYNMVKRNTTVDFEFICITDDATSINPDIRIIPLWENPCPKYAQTNSMRPNCYVRLRMFSDEMRDLIGEKFIWMDLDNVITGNIDHILNDPADFKMARIDGEFMPVNGSLCMIKAGARSDIWTGFNPNMVHPVTGLLRCSGRPVGSDQAWISLQLTEEEKAKTWGQSDGVYSYRCHLKKSETRENPIADLPQNACMVLFHGNFMPDDPEIQSKYKWVKANYY